MTVLEEDVEFLEHFGVKGMKWGVRKSKKEAGISRARDALVERNEREMRGIEKYKTGKLRKVEDTFLGKERNDKRIEKLIGNREAQNRRLKTGELHVLDRLAVIGNTSIFNLVTLRDE